MTTDKFNELVMELRNASIDTLVAKNAGYSSDADKLHNFNAGAEVMGGTAAQAAWGYMTKHLVALRDKIQRNDFSNRDDFLEKCQDIINYVVLIWCIGNEEMEKYASECVEAGNWPKLSTNGINTLREAVMYKLPGNVNACYEGGVLGCPGDYFRGAPVAGGGRDYLCDYDCTQCWSRPYNGEELLPDAPRA